MKRLWLRLMVGVFVLFFGLVGFGEASVLSSRLLLSEGQSVTELEKPTAEMKAKSKKKKKKKKKEEEKKKETEASSTNTPSSSSDVEVKEDGEYTSKEEVAAYIHQFGHLPSNYITKKEARELGWDRRPGSLDWVAPGKSIGGDRFGNYDEILPYKKGRQYYECDIDFDGWTRNEERIIYSNDGLIYYTDDHYNTFERLY